LARGGGGNCPISAPPLDLLHDPPLARAENAVIFSTFVGSGSQVKIGL